MNAQILINSVVQQTMVLLAHLATAGGSRAPLAQVANQVLLDLTTELQAQGVTKNVIADMFGIALRTYHRRMRSIAESESDRGRSVWEAILETIRHREPISARQIQQRFRYDDPAVVSGVLNDLSNSGIVYRAGRGFDARYRMAQQADFADDDEGGQARKEAYQYLVWLSVYRQGPIAVTDLSASIRMDEDHCRDILKVLVADGRVLESQTGETPTYTSARFDVAVGTTQGWEAAVLDHYQAVVSAICVKLRGGSPRSERNDVNGGGTYTLDIWPGHPFEQEALGTLAKVRQLINDLRERIDRYNDSMGKPESIDQVVFYMGQYFKSDRAPAGV